MQCPAPTRHQAHQSCVCAQYTHDTTQRDTAHCALLAARCYTIYDPADTPIYPTPAGHTPHITHDTHDEHPPHPHPPQHTRPAPPPTPPTKHNNYQPAARIKQESRPHMMSPITNHLSPPSSPAIASPHPLPPPRSCPCRRRPGRAHSAPPPRTPKTPRCQARPARPASARCSGSPARTDTTYNQPQQTRGRAYTDKIVTAGRRLAGGAAAWPNPFARISASEAGTVRLPHHKPSPLPVK